MEVAEPAYGIMKLFSALLLVMDLLLDHPGLSDDVDDLIEDQRLVAVSILHDHAIGLAEGYVEMAAGARTDVAGGN